MSIIIVGRKSNAQEIKKNTHQWPEISQDTASLFSTIFLHCLSVEDRFQEKSGVLWSDLKLLTGILHKLWIVRSREYVGGNKDWHFSSTLERRKTSERRKNSFCLKRKGDRGPERANSTIRSKARAVLSTNVFVYTSPNFLASGPN